MITVGAPVASTTTQRHDEQVPARPLPTPSGAFPPATARRYRGWTIAWLTAAAVAAGLSAASAPLWLQTAGLGMLLPGGGLFATGHLVLGAVVLVAFVLSVFVWWVIGMTVLPPLVWIGAAVAAAVAVHGALDGPGTVLAVATLPTAAALAYLTHRVRHAFQRRVGAAVNARLATVSFPITGDDVGARATLTELSAEDLELERFALDLALQPLDRFDGFVRYDQFREAALRYQLSFLGYALSLTQFNSTPAFSGYLAEAQARAIEKVQDRRVWSYWALENAWGRMSLRRDPIDTVGNVMLTGYLGTQIGMYEVLNDRRFSDPGALEFRWSPEERYRHDFRSVAESVMANVAGTDFALFSCEPNWIYTICNAFALTTLVSHDRLHGSGFMDRGGERLGRGYEREFLRPDGRIIGMRSKHLGLTWNLWSGTAVQMTTALWLHPTLPDIAQRAWWLLRPDLEIRDGHLTLPRAVSTRLDPGNYTFGSDAYVMSMAEVTACEMGDEEIALAARRTLERGTSLVRKHGAAKYAGMSTFSSMYALMARTMRAGSLRDIVAFGAPPAWTTGPRLNGADYPDVLVARAQTDGVALDLVLRPGDGPVRTTLRLDRLVPHAAYRARGVTDGDRVITADAEGRAAVEVDLGDRLAVRVSPV